jgi:putative peptidoglycan lipid II flippase
MVPAMTGDRPGQDPESTSVLPTYDSTHHAGAAFDSTDVLPRVDGEAAQSAGYPVDGASAATAEQPLVASEAGASVARSGAIMAVGSIVSRITGFVRTAAIGAAIGVYAIGDDYTLANTLPGMVYELLLGGVLASVVVPLLVRARNSDADRGEAYAQRLLSLAAIFLAGATVIAVVCAPWITALWSTSGADRGLVNTLSKLLLPMIFFYGMAALFAAVLNTRGHFAMPTFTPILNNLIVVAMAGAFIFLIPVTDGRDAASLTRLQVAVLGLGTTLGIVVQAVGLWPALRRVGFRWKWRWDFRQLHLRELARLSTWMLTYVVVSQVAVVVIFKLANIAANNGGSEGAAGPNIYNNAFLIFMMAHGIVAVSIITALMPRMSAAAAAQRHDELVAHLSLGTRLAAVVLIPATVLYAVLGQPLAISLFNWGNYDQAAAIDTGWVIAVAGLGLVPFAISQLQLFGFYAMRDTKTPALINMPVVALRVGIDVLLFVVLPATLVAAGLMAGNGISFVAAAAIGYGLLRRRLGPLGLRQVFATLIRLGMAGLVAAVPTLFVLLVMRVLWGTGKWASVAQLIVCSLVLVGAYAAAALVLRVREVRELVSMVRGRLGR